MAIDTHDCKEIIKLAGGAYQNNREVRVNDALVELDPTSDMRWDQYVADHPEGTIYHHSAWMQILTKTYGYPPCCIGLVSSEGNRLTGILPLMAVKSYLTGTRLVSLPFTTYCTPLMPESRLEEAMRLAMKRFPGTRHVELKFLKTENGSEESGPRSVKTPFVNQILSLKGDLNLLFKRLHRSCIRQHVQRAEREGLFFQTEGNESDLRRFYELMSKVRIRSGLPPSPFNFFLNMLRILGGKGLCDLVVVKFEGQVIAAGLLLKDKRNWHLEYAASDSNFLKLGPNQYLIWECIKGAKEQGAEFFDFGRTAVWQESLLEFKDRWQADRHIILHRYYPEKSVDPHWSDPSQSLLARVNKKLPPLLVEWEGRLLYRHRG